MRSRVAGCLAIVMLLVVVGCGKTPATGDVEAAVQRYLAGQHPEMKIENFKLLHRTGDAQAYKIRCEYTLAPKSPGAGGSSSKDEMAFFQLTQEKSGSWKVVEYKVEN